MVEINLLKFLKVKKKEPSQHKKIDMPRSKKATLADIPPPPPPLTTKERNLPKISKIKKSLKKQTKHRKLKQKRAKRKKHPKQKKLKKIVKLQKQRTKKKFKKLEADFKKQKVLEEQIRLAAQKRREEEKKQKQLETLRKLQEKERLKELALIQKLRKSKTKAQERSYVKEIKALIKRLDAGIKAIDKHEVILRNNIEKNLKLTNSKLGSIKADIKTEKEFLKECEDISNKIMDYEFFTASTSTRIAPSLQNLTAKYNSYRHKALGLRKAILAKISYLKGLNKKIDEQEKEEKGMEEDKKKILEVESLLTRKRLSRKIKRFFIVDKETQEHLKKLSEERAKEQEARIKREKIERQKKLREEEVLLAGQKEHEKLEKQSEFGERIKKIGRKRDLEKEKMMKGKLKFHFFKPKPKKQFITDQEEIQKAIGKLKTPSKKEPVTFVPRSTGIELNDIGYINQRILDARDALLSFDLKRAKNVYIDIIKIYNNLSDEDKKLIYEAVKELYDERKNAEQVVKR